jgi:hypothetical protein
LRRRLRKKKIIRKNNKKFLIRVKQKNKKLRYQQKQYLLLHRFRYFLELKLSSFLNYITFIFFHNQQKFSCNTKLIMNALIHKKSFFFVKKFANFRAIKTLHKIQSDIISSLMLAFFSANAQLIAEQFALGINRTRKQKQFIF